MRKRIHKPSTTRWLAVAAATVAGAVALSGCTGGGGGSLSGGGSGSGDGKKVTLVVPTSQAPWNPAYAKLVQEYQKETGNTVDLRAFPNPDVKTQEVNDVQSQRHSFDVYQINESDLVQFNENGWIQDLSKIDSGYKPDSEIFSYSNIANWNADMKVFDSEGTTTSQPLLGNLDIFIYRKDIYKQLGLKVPTTWDQVIENGKKIQEAKAAKYGGVFRTQGVAGTYAATFEFQALMNSAGASWFTQPGTDYTPTADSSAAVKAASWYHELAQLGPSATGTIGQAQVIAAMQSGDAAQTYAVAAAAAPLEDESNSAVAGKLGYAPLPKAADGSSSTATGLWVLGVPQGLSKERSKAALEYIKWMTSKKAMTLFAQYGGIPVRSDAYNPSGVSAAAKATLTAVKESADKLPKNPTSLRFGFSTDILNVTEPELQNIAAGSTSPEAGMKAIQSGLEGVVQKQKLPTK
jgi:multiple sugar transport system substrate-binding protein